MKKKAEGGPNMWVIGLILALIIFFVFIIINGSIFGKAKSGINYATLETRIRMCAARNNQVNIPGLDTVIIIDKDTDDFPDTCDICLGMGIDLGDFGRDGVNSRDSDNDFYPDTCDNDMNNPEEHECVYQLCKMNSDGECEDFLEQCCTDLYVEYVKVLMEESGAGATKYKCEFVNPKTIYDQGIGIA